MFLKYPATKMNYDTVPGYVSGHMMVCLITLVDAALTVVLYVKSYSTEAHADVAFETVLFDSGRGRGTEHFSLHTSFTVLAFPWYDW